ncbi:hypothetical protein ACFLV6_03345 [Chloroflexota bacterium]
MFWRLQRFKRYPNKDDMNIMKQMLRRHTILGLILIMSPVLFLAACGGGKEEPPPPPDTTIQTPALPPQTSTFTFENQFLSFDYGSEWRVSGRTDSSIVLTHKERPGDVLLSAQWVKVQASETADLVQLFRNQLDLLTTEVQRLEDIKIGSINAERYASLVSRDGQTSVVTLHVLFSSGNHSYLVTFSAGQDDFIAYTTSANQVINTIRVP